MKIKMESNPVSRHLPHSLDYFLQDLAQMTQAISYNDIISHAYSEDEVRKLTNIRRNATRWAMEMDIEDYEEYLINTVAPKVIAILKPDAIVNENVSELNPANIDLSEYEYRCTGQGYDNKWSMFCKVVDGRGKWVARHQETGEIREITYDQARGFESIETSGIAGLSRDLGKMLLPQTEAEDAECEQDIEWRKDNAYWYGYYTPALMPKSEKKIIVHVPTLNYDEAQEEFEASIPAPYTKYRVIGHFFGKDSFMGKEVAKCGFEYID